ncbi:MAG: GNAT family N-acetyltransferase [Candidatus Thermoplasmatota archaeon]|nr:GNAT family N-acetyltransferase [Candidatus Thermoplasmatota archaeon]
MPEPATLVPLSHPVSLEALAYRIYEEEANRQATGWMHEEDKGEAIASLVGLWHRRAAKGWTTYAIQRDGRTVGLAGFGPVTDPDDPPGLGVYLLERGQGIGSWAACELVERARKAGAKRMETVAHAGNMASHRMLEKAGFRRGGPCEAAWAVASGEPWVVWVLDLP